MFCKFKFCIEHAHARKHGCDEAIAKAGREKYGSGGGGTFGAGRPTRNGGQLWYSTSQSIHETQTPEVRARGAARGPARRVQPGHIEFGTGKWSV